MASSTGQRRRRGARARLARRIGAPSTWASVIWPRSWEGGLGAAARAQLVTPYYTGWREGALLWQQPMGLLTGGEGYTAAGKKALRGGAGGGSRSCAGAVGAAEDARTRLAATRVCLSPSTELIGITPPAGDAVRIFFIKALLIQEASSFVVPARTSTTKRICRPTWKGRGERCFVLRSGGMAWAGREERGRGTHQCCAA